MHHTVEQERNLEGVRCKVIYDQRILPYIYEESFLKFLTLFIVTIYEMSNCQLSLVWEARDCIQRKTLCMEPYAKLTACYSNYLIVYFIVSYPPPQQRSLLLAEHICICLLIFKTTNRKRESMGKGEGRDESWPYVMGNAWSDFILTPRRSWL